MKSGVYIVGNDKADEWPGLIEFNQEIYFITAFERMHKNAFLKLMAAELTEVTAQGIANPAAFLGDIKENDAPFFVPGFRPLNSHFVYFVAQSPLSSRLGKHDSS